MSHPMPGEQLSDWCGVGFDPQAVYTLPSVFVLKIPTFIVDRQNPRQWFATLRFELPARTAV